MTSADRKAAILQACKDNFDSNQDFCNYFVQAVFLTLTKIVLTGTADELVDYFSATPSGWFQVTREEGILKTDDGWLVLAGLKSKDHHDGRSHGHLAVVVPGTLYHGKYPRVWCGGGPMGQSQGDKTVGEVWNTKDRDKVKYFYYSLYQ
ncbi:MAG TPA: hypothetical protein VG456_13895 [Candidatus Sulfopaludibacter sp.]|jgi:hypothetical protein|nr:hypothetical protein [Candidatus Sulfopaludibacter sp.]